MMYLASELDARWLTAGSRLAGGERGGLQWAMAPDMSTWDEHYRCDGREAQLLRSLMQVCQGDLVRGPGTPALGPIGVPEGMDQLPAHGLGGGTVGPQELQLAFVSPT